DCALPSPTPDGYPGSLAAEGCWQGRDTAVALNSNRVWIQISHRLLEGLRATSTEVGLRSQEARLVRDGRGIERDLDAGPRQVRSRIVGRSSCAHDLGSALEQPRLADPADLGEEDLSRVP